jgi:hypothetical protein
MFFLKYKNLASAIQLYDVIHGQAPEVYEYNFKLEIALDQEFLIGVTGKFFFAQQDKCQTCIYFLI